MRLAVVGGGPAGLYAAQAWKRRHAADTVELFEQNAPDATFGFGVVFSDRALDFLRDADGETHAAIAPHLETWRDITLNHRGATIPIDGVGFAAIGRLALLRILQDRAAASGVVMRYETPVTDPGALDGYDLVIAADGVNSIVQRAGAQAFGTSIRMLANKFAWFGTTQRFDTLTQTFVAHEVGTFNAHHYRYSSTMSTFIVECDPQTWRRAGFAAMTENETRLICAHIFAEVLAGRPLISNRSVWRNFPVVSNARWSVGNKVLVGDALHTAHFSIGSGTRLALEDVVALIAALDEHPGDIPSALAAYEAARKPALERIVAAANASADWYERFPEHMRLAPYDLAMSYIMRSGRVSDDRLRAMAPKFAAAYAANVA